MASPHKSHYPTDLELKEAHTEYGLGKNTVDLKEAFEAKTALGAWYIKCYFEAYFNVSIN